MSRAAAEEIYELHARVCKAIADGKYDHVPEQAFFMCGGIEDVERKAKELERP